MQAVSEIEMALIVSKKSKREILIEKITPLTDENLMSCEAFWMGNDPITQESLVAHQSAKPFVLVGTSMFGSIKLASYLAKNTDFIPDVVIVDNSRQVAKCWALVKTYFAASTEKNPEKFVDSFILYLQENNFYSLSMDIWDADTAKELRDLLFKMISDSSLDYVKKMVSRAVIIQQSWADLDTFNTIAEVYKDIDIYAYPSNIIHCISDTKVQQDVASCIEALNPRLSIQTNLFDGAPTTVHLITDNSAATIMTTLGPGPFQKKKEEVSVVVEQPKATAVVINSDKEEMNSHRFFASPGLAVTTKTGTVATTPSFV